MMILASYQETCFMSTAFCICDGFMLSHPLFHSILIVNNRMRRLSGVKYWTFSYESEESPHLNFMFMTLTSLALNFNLQSAELTSHKYFGDIPRFGVQFINVHWLRIIIFVLLKQKVADGSITHFSLIPCSMQISMFGQVSHCIIIEKLM